MARPIPMKKTPPAVQQKVHRAFVHGERQQSDSSCTHRVADQGVIADNGSEQEDKLHEAFEGASEAW